MSGNRIRDGVYHPEIDKNKPCDICGSTQDIQHTLVKVEESPCIKSFIPHVYAYLCLDCKNKGWIIFRRADPSGKISYYNLKTEELKRSK